MLIKNIATALNTQILGEKALFAKETPKQTLFVLVLTSSSFQTPTVAQLTFLLLSIFTSSRRPLSI